MTYIIIIGFIQAFFFAVLALAKKNKEKIKEANGSDEDKAMDSIKWLINNDWGKSNEIEGQASERFKALSFNDSDISNKFLDEVNKFTSTLEDKYLK